MKKKSVWIAVCTAALLALGMLVSGIAVAAADKVDVCHVTGNGGFQLINVSSRAATAHLDHGDSLPGAILSEGTPYPGLYGSTVTATTLINAGCIESTVLRIQKAQGYAAGGWAGWSCVEPGYPHALGGGPVPETASVLEEGIFKPGATIGGSTYPVTPWNYTYATGEEGYILRAGLDSPTPTGVYVLCGE